MECKYTLGFANVHKEIVNFQILTVADTSTQCYVQGVEIHSTLVYFICAHTSFTLVVTYLTTNSCAFLVPDFVHTWQIQFCERVGFVESKLRRHCSICRSQ